MSNKSFYVPAWCGEHRPAFFVSIRGGSAHAARVSLDAVFTSENDIPEAASFSNEFVSR
jgi:hypothetical protein